MAGTARRRFPVKGTGRTFCAYIPGMRMAMGVNLIRVREVLSIPQPMESNATRLGDLEIDLDPNPRFCVAQYGSRTLESLSGVSGCQVSMSGTQGRYSPVPLYVSQYQTQEHESQCAKIYIGVALVSLNPPIYGSLCQCGGGDEREECGRVREKGFTPSRRFG